MHSDSIISASRTTVYISLDSKIHTKVQAKHLHCSDPTYKFTLYSVATCHSHELYTLQTYTHRHMYKYTSHKAVVAASLEFKNMTAGNFMDHCMQAST